MSTKPAIPSDSINANCPTRRMRTSKSRQRKLTSSVTYGLQGAPEINEIKRKYVLYAKGRNGNGRKVLFQLGNGLDYLH
jgi:hypothetical protein